MVQPVWKAVWRYFKKTKNGTALWPSHSTSGNLSKETQYTNLKEHKHPYDHCSVIYSHQDGSNPSIHQLMNGYNSGTFTTMEFYSVVKKEENVTLCNSMNGPGEHYAKGNKPVRESQIPYDFARMWNLMNKPN